MKIIITEEQYKTLNEMIKLDIKVGDTLMGGKFKNKKVVVKTIGKNDNGDITINGKPDLKFYIDYIKKDWATIQVWEFDKNDELVDEDGFDAYDIKFDELDRKVFNQIFDSMINYILL